MDAACGDEEYVTLLHVVIGQGIGDGVVLHHRLILLRCNLLFQTVVEATVSHAVPHFRLAVGIAMTVCNLVVGVDLYREVLLGIDELDEQREFITEALVVLFSDEQSFLFAHQLVETFAFLRAVGHDGLTAADARDLPTLANIRRKR